MRGGHTPVMLREAMRLLALRPGMRVVDATLGAGGHAEAICERIGPGGVLIGIDRDGDAVTAAAERLGRFGDRVRIYRANYTELGEILEREGIDKADAFLFDLGLSGIQLASEKRGFSFAASGPLDMRMDRRGGVTAAALLERWSEEDLARVLREFGEEPLARSIARELKRRGVPEGTKELADLVVRIYRRAGRRAKRHPATRVFQALRIAVNEELANLKKAIPLAAGLAAPGARIAVISFHSLEDRIVKREFSRLAKGCICPPGLPVCRCGRRPELRIVTRKPVRPEEEEVARNPRARSARLRAAEKI